jgi:hypothetical protein
MLRKFLGPGSVMGMAGDPVTVRGIEQSIADDLDRCGVGTAHPNVNLVDTLNGGEFTVYARPTMRSPRSRARPSIR